MGGSVFNHDFFAPFGVLRPYEAALWTARLVNDTDAAPVAVPNARFKKSNDKDLLRIQVIAEANYMTVSFWGSKSDFDPKPNDLITRVADGTTYRVINAGWKVADNLCVMVAQETVV